MRAASSTPRSTWPSRSRSSRLPDGVHHALSKVRAPEALRAIVEGVARSTLLIADGHHRYETALRYSEEAAAAAGEGAASAAASRGEHRYFMTFLANGDDPDLVVFPTHRHVHSLASFSFDDLVSRARDLFEVEALASGVTADVVLERLASSRRARPERRRCRRATVASPC